MRIPGLLGMAGVLLAASLAAQEHPKPLEKPKPPPKPSVDFSKFKFMEGCWRGQLNKDEIVEENWTSPSDNLLLATTRYLMKERATGYEFTRIQWVDSMVVFAASSNGKPEDVYPLKTLADGYVLFENLEKKGFPQRIMYREASDGALIPRNEGEGPSVELRFHRVKCPGADIKIKN
ncbi:MAG TPA: DUF6265 family protein [Gemmatimonadales bacterium]|nr:DUF6265 family protein [Gemmatimonadales bacterium]